MKFRVSNWIDTKNLIEKFGVQARPAGKAWHHVARDGVALIFDTEAEAQSEVHKLRAIYANPESPKP